MTTSPRQHLPILDGLRFFAAFFVMASHYAGWVITDQHLNNPVIEQIILYIKPFSALGMTVFFVLSGFVIHYNYRDTCRQQGGAKRFFIARFTRLYPLFIVLFLGEFVSSFIYRRGSCGHAGIHWGLFFALPYYLTFTQSWFYGVICNDSLVQQYHMVSGVSWSLSVEAFFYLAYLFLVYHLVKQRSVKRHLIAILLANAATLAYLLLCHQYEDRIDYVAKAAFGPIASRDAGYANTFLRWLYYFNPLVNLAAFFTGCVVANIYLMRRGAALSVVESRFGGIFTFAAIALLLAVYAYLYSLGQTTLFPRRIATSLYVPMVALVIYCLLRYSHTWFACITGSWPLVKLGEASYSIYLLHALFGWNARDFYYLHLNPWLLYALSMACVLIISRLCYMYFERPAQQWLRGKMGDARAAILPEGQS